MSLLHKQKGMVIPRGSFFSIPTPDPFGLIELYDDKIVFKWLIRQTIEIPLSKVTSVSIERIPFFLEELLLHGWTVRVYYWSDKGKQEVIFRTLSSIEKIIEFFKERGMLQPINKFPIKPSWQSIVIAAVLGLFVGVGAVFFLRGLFQTPADYAPPVIQQTLPPQPSPSPQVLDASDWQTYRNEEFGFEVKYPKDTFIPVEGSALPTQFNGVNAPYTTVSFAYDKIISDYAEIVAEFRIISAIVPYEVRWTGKETPTEEAKVWSTKIEGVPVAVREGRVNNQDLTTYSFVWKGNYYELRLAFYDSDKDKILHKEIFNQILTTFRFVDR